MNSSDSALITGAGVEAMATGAVVVKPTGALVEATREMGAGVSRVATGALVLAREAGAGVSGTVMIMGAGVLLEVAGGERPSGGDRTTIHIPNFG